MKLTKDGQPRGAYTHEFKLDAIRLVESGQTVTDAAKILGIPNQTLDGWCKLSKTGRLKGAGDKPVSAQQMELARLRPEIAKLRMERDILKKATAYFARQSL